MAKKDAGAKKVQKQASANGDSRSAGDQRGLRFGGLAAAALAAAAVVAAAVRGATPDRPPPERRQQAQPGAAQDAPDWNAPSEGSADAVAAAARAAGLDVSLPETELPGAEPEVRVISEAPRIYLLERLLSPAECEFLIRLVDGRLKPAGVVLQTEDKHTVQEQSRNNEQIWITPQEESSIPVLRHVIKRLHRVAHIPDTDAEALQIGRYTSGQKYESHVDTDPAHDVERPATLLIYLSDVESGGDTLFPLEKSAECASRWHHVPGGAKKFGCSKCCDSDTPGTIRIRPKRGNAVLFFNHDLSGQVDRLSEHAACPVKAGAKWIAQRWFRLKPYANIRFPPDPRFDGLPAPGAPLLRAPWDGVARELSRKAPRAFLLENLLSDAECDELVGLAAALGAPEAAAGADVWSLGGALGRGEPPLLAAVAKRLHRAARVPEAHGEPPLLARSAAGAAAAPLAHDAEGQAGRVATILVFLSDAGGGDAVLARGKCRSAEECCQSKKAIRVPPRKGRGLLLFSRLGRKADKAAAYGACPVDSGTKWTLQLRFRASPVRASGLAADPVYDVPARSQVLVE